MFFSRFTPAAPDRTRSGIGRRPRPWSGGCECESANDPTERPGAAAVPGNPLSKLSRILMLATLLTGSAQAYDPLGPTWASGDIVMHLQLGELTTPLLDGSPDWATVAQSALEEWNAQLGRSRLTWIRNSTAEVRRGNRSNNVAFRPDVYGSAFGDRTLAVTLGSSNTGTGRYIEQDVLFNSTLTWNSYRGPLRNSARDLRRVALHEFGHVLGLDHPDQAQPVQTVASIMNSIVSNVELLQFDDILGVQSLYGANASSPPTIAAQPQSRTVQVGEPYTMAVTVGGAGEYTYTWSFLPAGSVRTEPFRLATGPLYTIGAVQLADAGTYSVRVNNALSGNAVTSNSAQLSVGAIATSVDTTLANISTRGVVGRDNDVLIAGLVIGGTTSKDVLIRAAGPALGDFGVGGTLVDPTLRIVNSRGETVMANDDWEGGGNPAEIRAAAKRLGAFEFKSGSRDSALLATLPPGSYTAIVSGADDQTGIALVEAYDADPSATVARTRKLVNIATRGRVDGGDNVLIAGLVVSGPGPRTFLIRAIGPTLMKPPFTVAGALRDPFLQIYRGETLLRENDDWDAPLAAQPAVREAAVRVGAFPLQEIRDGTGLDAAMLITLQPGSYTAKVSGFQGGTGVALVEVYELP